jgi:hypothetical protein
MFPVRRSEKEITKLNVSFSFQGCKKKEWKTILLENNKFII